MMNIVIEFVLKFFAMMGIVYLIEVIVYAIRMNKMKAGKREQVRCPVCGEIHEREEE